MVRHRVLCSPTRDYAFELEVTFCVRGVLSPLLSNIVLDELDRELERRGLRFARYADDCNIYVRSQRAGERVMESITRFTDGEAQAQGEPTEECGGASHGTRKFLGFSFTNAGIPKRRIAPKAVDRFKERVRELTSRTRGCEHRTNGGGTVPRICGDGSAISGNAKRLRCWKVLKQWIRRRLRSAIWKQWKRGSVRFAELRKRGVGKDLAAQTAGSAHGPWRSGELARHSLSRCPMLTSTRLGFRD